MTGVAGTTERGTTGGAAAPERHATAAPGGDIEAAFEARRHRLLVLSLFSSPAAMILSNVIGTLIPLFCWYAAADPEFLVVSAITAVVVAGRIALAIHYHRIKDGPLGDRKIAWLDRLFFAGATAFSLCLGVACYLALAHTESIACHILTIVCAIAYSAGYVARNAGRPVFVIVQLFCFCSPMIVGLVAATDPLYAWVAVFIGFFILTNVVIAFSLNRNLIALDAAQRQSESLAASLRTQNVTLDTALNSMTHGLALFGRSLDMEVTNLRFAELLRLAGPDLVPGHRLTAILDRLIGNQILSPPAARDVGQACRRALKTGGTSTVEIETETGEALLVTAELTADGGILLLVEDCTERKAAAAQIERMAHTDNLTGLPNRFRITQLLRQSCEAAGTQRGETALLYIDLDNFKAVNDSLGHEAGDQLLVQVAARLRSVLKPGQIIARLGGDEFLLLAPELDEDAAVELGQDVVTAMQSPFQLRGALLPVTTSVGVALAPRHGRDPGDALRAADMALYEAKNDGRNRVVVFRETIAAAVQTRRELELDLHEACRTGNLFLAYQPIVDLAHRRVNSFEALMRWRHPTRGLVPPSDFIPIAEQTGLIATMGDWAIRRACMDAAAWPGAASVAVNLSAVQFREPQRLIQSVKDALLISRLPPERLELEVTESLLIEDQDGAMEAIRALRRIGVRFSLDDFGIGYSSLAYLARYPFSKVKIDRSFAENVASDPASRTIIEMICQMAGRLSMVVVVEGIETEQQLSAIVELGAAQGQGWLFGRPVANEALLSERCVA